MMGILQLCALLALHKWKGQLLPGGEKGRGMRAYSPRGLRESVRRQGGLVGQRLDIKWVSLRESARPISLPAPRKNRVFQIRTLCVSCSLTIGCGPCPKIRCCTHNPFWSHPPPPSDCSPACMCYSVFITVKGEVYVRDR
jgi:hypothetical protein